MPRQVIKLVIFDDRQAFTDEPYKKIFKIDEFPTTDAAPMTGMPVPRTKHKAIEIPNFLLKITLIKVYKLAQPKLIIILPKMAKIRELALIVNERPVRAPARVPPIR